MAKRKQEVARYDFGGPVKLETWRLVSSAGRDRSTYWIVIDTDGLKAACCEAQSTAVIIALMKAADASKRVRIIAP